MKKDSAAQSPTNGPSSSSPAAGAAQAVPKLTARQQHAYDLVTTHGKSYEEAAREMGISPSTLSRRLVAARKKLGLAKVKVSAAEFRKPEKFAAVFDAMTEPLTKLSDALREAGVPPGAAEGILKRIRAKYYGAMVEARNLKKYELDELLGKKIHMMLSYIDDKVAGEASARDLAMGVAQLIEKQQLIRGEPTQIVSDHERKKLHELAPALLAEVKRRGLTVEGQVTEKSVAPA